MEYTNKRYNPYTLLGVCWDSSNDQWMAYIDVDWKRIYLGSFLYLSDAINARKEAEKEYFGELDW